MVPPQAQRGTPVVWVTQVMSYRFPQARQVYRFSLPWSSSTFRLPAIWWRPSMFWVMTARSLPCRSSWARA